LQYATHLQKWVEYVIHSFQNYFATKEASSSHGNKKEEELMSKKQASNKARERSLTHL